MTAERWEQVKQLFYEALDLTPEQRPQFLAVACGSDVALRGEVKRLLAEHEQASAAFLEPPDGRRLAATESYLGTTLDGRYRIEKELGRGGSGVVYLARDQQLHSKARCGEVSPPVGRAESTAPGQVLSGSGSALPHPPSGRGRCLGRR